MNFKFCSKIFPYDMQLLVLTPTRELANQVSQVISSLSNHIRVVPVFGGANLNTQGALMD